MSYVILGLVAGAVVGILVNRDGIRSHVNESVELTGAELSLEERIMSDPKPVLVDFTAKGCGPCRSMEPVVSHLSQKYAGRATVLKVDVGEHPDLARRYNVRAYPTFLIFRDGQVVARIVGAVPRRTLEEQLESAR
jgi:thioredoxin 1